MTIIFVNYVLKLRIKELIEQINLLKNKPFIASETYKSILETYLNDRMNAENILNEIFS